MRVQDIYLLKLLSFKIVSVKVHLHLLHLIILLRTTMLHNIPPIILSVCAYVMGNDKETHISATTCLSAHNF